MFLVAVGVGTALALMVLDGCAPSSEESHDIALVDHSAAEAREISEATAETRTFETVQGPSEIEVDTLSRGSLCTDSSQCPVVGQADLETKGACIQVCGEDGLASCGTDCHSHSDCIAGERCVGGVFSVENLKLPGKWCFPEGKSSCPSYCVESPGDFLCPCEGTVECLAYCVQGRYGRFCTQGLCEACEYGLLACMQLVKGAESVFTCLDRLVMLCSPCSSDLDCRLPWAPEDDLGDRCVSHGEAGSYCGVNCADPPWDIECPVGYSCVAGQCTPDLGECD